MGTDRLNAVRNVARTGNLFFGIGTLHHLPFRTQRLRLLRQALDLGFRRFDVAPAYGNGLNELDLGRALDGYRSECQVTTKFGIPIDLYGARHPDLFFLIRGIRRLNGRRYGDEYKRRIFSRVEMARSLEGSLKRLKREYIDDFMIHEPLGLLTKAQLADLHEMASRLKQQGKILRWGVAGPAASIVQFVGDPMFDVLQFPLEDHERVASVPPQRRIAYGVYRFYLASLSRQAMTFAAFVTDWLGHSSTNLIVATTVSATLASFQECL